MSNSILKILNSVCEGWKVEYRFDTTNRYRFDFVNLIYKIAVDIEGGVWSGGGHTRGKGYIKDMRKYNLGQLKGYIILRYTYGEEDQIPKDVKKAIDLRKNQNGMKLND